MCAYLPSAPSSTICASASPTKMPKFSATSRCMVSLVLVVGGIGDFVQQLRGGLPVLFGDCLVEFFVEFVGLEFGFSGCGEGYRKDTPSMSLLTICRDY